ncbi:MAG: hypothetical protein ACREOM_13090, partial [Candidatus Dormibacteraceae bacterium]
PDLREAVRDLPAEHAIQISRLTDRKQQEELVARAPQLTYKQVRAAVDRLRCDADLSVDDALSRTDAGDVAFDEQLAILGDLCRQLVRLILLLHGDAERRRCAAPALADLRSAIDDVLEAA